ncbi:MAG: alpha/beta fold hydrolase [Hyphomicrobiaceae bacterium]
MKSIAVDKFEMPYVDIGRGLPLVAIHGSLGDFRSWSPVMGPLSGDRRLIVPSLRRFFPERWDGKGDGFTIAEHTADVIAFLEGLGLGPVDLMGHSRGGHIAFRVAQQRPDLIRKLILAEPGGELDATLLTPGEDAPSGERVASILEAARLIASGEVDKGLESFVDRIYGAGAWAKRPAAAKQMRRDNAYTLIGQINEQRAPFSRAEAESIRTPTLLIGGELTRGMIPIVLKALTGAIPGAKCVMIPNASHSMFEQAPVRFSEIVREFLGSP